MEWLFNKLHFQKMDDWYQIQVQHFVQFKGIKLLTYYNNSILNLLKNIYPGKFIKI